LEKAEKDMVPSFFSKGNAQYRRTGKKFIQLLREKEKMPEGFSDRVREKCS